MLSIISRKKIKKKLNSTIKDNFNYFNDIQNTNIIDIVYKKDKILYDMLVLSKKDFIELSFDEFLRI